MTLEVQRNVRTLADPVAVEFAREFQAGTVHVPLPVEFFDGLVAESLKLPARLWREVLDGLLAFDDAADLRRISAPTLIMWGERTLCLHGASSHAWWPPFRAPS